MKTYIASASIKPLNTNYRRIILTLVLTLSGCNWLQTTRPINPERTFQIDRTRVILMQECPITGEPEADKRYEESGMVSALVGIIGPTLVESGVGALSAAIIRASGKDDENTTITAKAYDYFYVNKKNPKESNFVTIQNPDTKCIVLVSGKYGRSMQNSGPNTSATWKPNDYEGDPSDWEIWDELRLVSAPRFYMEADMVVPKNRGEFQIRPRYILYNKKFNKSGNDDKRDLEIRFQLAQAGGGENKTGSTGTIALLNVPVGRYMGLQEFKELSEKDFRTGFLAPPSKDSTFTTKESVRQNLVSTLASLNLAAAIPMNRPPSDTQTKEITRMQCLHKGIKEKKCESAEKIAKLIVDRDRALAKESIVEAQNRLDTVLNLNKQVFGAPFELTVSITETRDINKWLLAIGEALATNKKAISDEISKNVFPSLRKKADIEAQTSSNTNNSAYLAAMIDVEIAQIALDAAEKGDNEALKLNKKKELIQKKAVANVAAITAGKVIPFLELL